MRVKKKRLKKSDLHVGKETIKVKKISKRISDFMPLYFVSLNFETIRNRNVQTINCLSSAIRT
jgi:hypothetical protein